MIGQAKRLYELTGLSNKVETGKPENLFAFTSGKGGTGKTVVSLNFAYSLAKLNKKVLLIDVDANMANINILLNEKSKRTLLDFYNSTVSFNELIHTYSRGFDIIYGDSGRLDYSFSVGDRIERLFDEIKKIAHRYDYIFLDTGSGIGEDVLAFIRSSSKVILVVTPEPTAIMDAYVILKNLKYTDAGTHKYVLVNKATNSDEGLNAFNNLNNASLHFLNEGIKLIGIIEYDSNVVESIMTQQLIAEHYPVSLFARRIRGLAMNFQKKVQVANNNQ